jgi:hypothetical protein
LLFRRLLCIGLVIAFTACSARHREAASAVAVSDAVGSQAPLKACDVRSFDAAGVNVTLTSNVDASLGGIRLSDGDPVVRAQVLAAIRQRFGMVKTDRRVQTRPNKWGLTVLIDSCGRPLDLSPSTKPANP